MSRVVLSQGVATPQRFATPARSYDARSELSPRRVADVHAAGVQRLAVLFSIALCGCELRGEFRSEALDASAICIEKAWDDDDPFQITCPHPSHRIEALKTGDHEWIVCRCPQSQGKP